MLVRPARVLLMPVAGALSACALASACTAPVRPHAGVDIVVGLYPYQYVAQRIVGSHGTVTNLTKPGVEPHDLELTPRQVAAVSVADLAIYQQQLQPSLDDAVEHEPPRHGLDITRVVAMSGDDPHVWQDPVRMEAISRAIGSKLAAIDPKHRADYLANARSLVAELRRLDQQFATGLAHCVRRDIVTSHAAFGYLADRYHLTMIAIAGLSPDNEPSAERIVELQRIIERDGLTTVFSEELGTKKYAQSLSSDLGLKAAVLSPIEGLTSTSDHDTYLSLMRRNLGALRTALGCR